MIAANISSEDGHRPASGLLIALKALWEVGMILDGFELSLQTRVVVRQAGLLWDFLTPRALSGSDRLSALIGTPPHARSVRR